jgi:hypothetical protein
MKGIMVEHFSPNLIPRLRKNRKSSAMLTKKLNKYMKLVEICNGSGAGSVEDEQDPLW